MARIACGGYGERMTSVETTYPRRRGGALMTVLGALWSARSWRATLHALLGLPLGIGACSIAVGQPGTATVVRTGVQRPATGALPHGARGRDPGTAPRGRQVAAAAAAAVALTRPVATAQLPPRGTGHRRRRRRSGGDQLAGWSSRARVCRRALELEAGWHRPGRDPAGACHAARGSVAGPGRGSRRRGRRPRAAR